VVRLGLVADVQYADKDDKLVAGSVRHYRNAIHKLARVVDAFESESTALDAVLQLGDLVDGRGHLDASRADLELVMSQFARLPLPLYHVLGNHCLLCGREWLLKRLGIRPYYDVSLEPRNMPGQRASTDAPESGWRLVVLDCLDISVHWDDSNDPRRLQAERFLQDRAGSAPNAVPYNGGIGESQLVWLEGILTACRARGEFVLIAGHVPIAPQSAAPSLLLWNHEEVLSLFRAYRDVVKLVLAGHEHDGGYAQMDGIHYLTLPGVVNAAEGEDNAYAILELVGHSFARLHGFGRVPSRLLVFESGS
jgi:predicted MPP superfamily phosphohydrolase